MSSSLLRLIDLFGKPVLINIAGKDKFKSKFGGVCTLLFFGYLIWATYNSGKDLFKRSEPNSVSSEIFIENPRPLTLSPETFPLGVSLLTPNALGGALAMQGFIDESIYTVEFVYIRYDVTEMPDGSYDSVRTKIYLDQERCTKSHFGEWSKKFDQIPMDTVHCIAKKQPKLDKVQVLGSYSEKAYSFIVINIKACNRTTSKVECASDAKIKQYLSKAFFDVLYLNMAVDPKNYTTPDYRYREIYETTIDPTQFKQTNIYLGHVNVTSDAGWIVPEPETKQYAKVNKITETFSLDPDPKGAIIAFVIQVDFIETVYSRSYKTIQNVLAEVGGLSNVGLAVLFIITAPYLKMRFALNLMNELFDIDLMPSNGKGPNTNKKQNKKAKKRTLTLNTLEYGEIDSPKGIQTTQNGEARIDIGTCHQSMETLFTKGEEARLKSRITLKSPQSERDPLFLSSNNL